ncbi:hypothetical protein B0H14DRAFT_2569199 [Mycena olivaceomarginata]|nr:hypothetical protein B0H14DRAFT_2569199 [Mycena olivaceomarginata]
MFNMVTPHVEPNPDRGGDSGDEPEDGDNANGGERGEYEGQWRDGVEAAGLKGWVATRCLLNALYRFQPLQIPSTDLWPPRLPRSSPPPPPTTSTASTKLNPTPLDLSQPPAPLPPPSHSSRVAIELASKSTQDSFGPDLPTTTPPNADDPDTLNKLNIAHAARTRPSDVCTTPDSSLDMGLMVGAPARGFSTPPHVPPRSRRTSACRTSAPRRRSYATIMAGLDEFWIQLITSTGHFPNPGVQFPCAQADFITGPQIQPPGLRSTVYGSWTFRIHVAVEEGGSNCGMVLVRAPDPFLEALNGGGIVKIVPLERLLAGTMVP